MVALSLQGYPFEIYDASTASYGKKVSSTYQRYACGTFLPYSLYLHRLFQKAYGKWYFRTATEGGGSTQKRRFCAAKTRVQKCTRMYTSGQAISKGLRRGCFSTDMDVGGSRQERVRSANSSLSRCTRMYNGLTVYFQKAYGRRIYGVSAHAFHTRCTKVRFFSMVVRQRFL